MAENYWYSSLSGQEIEDTLLGAVRGDIDQNQTTSWKARARANIGAGESNSTFKILGYFDTLEDLQEWLQQLPHSGDAYGIGTASPYDVYVYDGIHNTWVDNGPIAYSDALIDDNDISLERTWSSTKINTEVGAVRTLANAAQSAADAAQTTADGKAPISHASPATTYGVGDGTNYGHVKLSDTPDANQDVGDGVAATPAAVQAAIDKATRTLLWTNPNPDAAFNAQTITLSESASNFTKIEVVFFVNNTVNNPLTEIVQFESGYRMHAWYWADTGGTSGVAYFMVRQITNQVTGTTIDFANLFHTPNKGTVSQNILVPWKVYGLRA